MKSSAIPRLLTAAVVLSGVVLVSGCGSQSAAPEATGSQVSGSPGAPAPSASPNQSGELPPSSVPPGASESAQPAQADAASANPAAPKTGKKPKSGHPTPMPTNITPPPPEAGLDPGEQAPSAGKGPSVEQIAAKDNKQVVKVGPFKQAVGDVATYQTQYFIGRGGNQIGSVVIATGSQIGGAPNPEDLEAFKNYGAVEQQAGGTILRYKAGNQYLAIGYFGNKLITIGAGSLADLKSLYDYFRAVS